jgi:hypothetical protein
MRAQSKVCALFLDRQQQLRLIRQSIVRAIAPSRRSRTFRMSQKRYFLHLQIGKTRTRPVEHWPEMSLRTQPKFMASPRLNLTIPASRSPLVRLGGYVILPRILDEARARLSGKNGSYIYACPLGESFQEFTGIDTNALKKQLATGKRDGAILGWVKSNENHQPTESEIGAWSPLPEPRTPRQSRFP